MIYRLIHHAGSNVVPASRVVYHASKPETLVVQLLLYKSSEDARFFYEFHWHNKPQLIDQAERAHRFGYYINTHVQMSKCIRGRKIANVPWDVILTVLMAEEFHLQQWTPETQGHTSVRVTWCPYILAGLTEELSEINDVLIKELMRNIQKQQNSVCCSIRTNQSPCKVS